MITRIALIVTVVFAVACGGEAPPPDAVPASTTPAAPIGTAAGEHAHTAPHGGVLVELGEHFAFLEVVLDGDAGSVTIYVLDGEAEKGVRITQPSVSLTFDAPASVAGQTLVLNAKANALTGETVGDTSEFVAVNPALKGQTTFTARVGEVTVKGQPFKDLTVSK
jgi:hypothetical protein